MNNDQRDEVLWRIARKRAAFKRSFSVYVFVNAFLVGVWYFSTGSQSYFWPIWPILGWGIGILFQYINAYQGKNFFSDEQEYERLKNEQNKKL